MKKIVCALLILTAFASCKKDKETSSDSTKVFFYTNAQMILNCGPFNVDVYVDDKLCGTLENPYSDKELSIPCDTKDTDGAILAVDVEQGKEHTWKAVANCGIEMTCRGGFCTSEDGCQTIFIDFRINSGYPNLPD